MTVGEFFNWALYLPEQGSTFAPKVDRLHIVIISTAMLVAAVIFTLAAIFILRFRRRAPFQPTRKIQTSLRWEIAFVGVPLVVFLSWFFIGFRDFVALQSPPKNTLDVYVTAKQWMWKFTYAEGPQSVNVLRVPTERPVRLLLTSRDVIHSFFVPAFRIKQDAVPGLYTETWFEVTKPGRYRVMCAEFCGLQHSMMWAEVVALEPKAYERWIAEQRRSPVARADATPSAEERELSQELTPLPVLHEREEEPERGNLREQGRRLAAEKGCLQCHTLDGAPHIGPTWLELYRRKETLQNGETVIADEAYLTESMMLPQAKIVAGFQPVMPSFLGALEAAEVAALVEFIKSLHGETVPDTKTEAPLYERTR